MRALFALVVIAAALFLGVWWFQNHHAAGAYAPRGAQDSDLAVQPAPEPTPPAPPPTDFKSDGSATLPSGPIPYDQLNKPGTPPSPRQTRTRRRKNTATTRRFFTER